MKTIKVSQDFLDENKTKSVGGCYFEASMDDLSYCNMQINIRDSESLTDEIKKQIKENFNDFIDSISGYGWKDLLEKNNKTNLDNDTNLDNNTIDNE